MRKRALILLLAYFAIAYLVLFFYGDQRYFCSPARTGQNYLIMVTKMAALCAGWGCASVAIGAGLVKHSRQAGILGSALISSVFFFSISFWIYRGYGHFLLENTWADVSCFFTEGYGIAFPVIVAPLLSGLSVLYAWLLFRQISEQRR